MSVWSDVLLAVESSDPQEVGVSVRPETGLALSCFGWPKVSWQGQSVDALGSSKTLALLVYLICNQRIHARPKLVGLLWSEVDEAKGRVSLRTALYTLTQELPGVFEVTRKTVGISPTVDVWCDVIVLQEWSSSKDVIAQKKILSLSREPFLAGFYTKDAPLFDDWVSTMRGDLSLHVTSQLSVAVAQSEEQRHNHDVLHWGYRLLRWEPWDESVYRSLMLAHGRLREFHKAIQLYRRCQEELQAALGLDLSEETEQVYERILHARQFPQPTLPTASVSCIGRQHEKEQLGVLLQQERMVVLLGMGGVGKSVLALDIANTVQEHFLHGTAWIALSSVTRQEQLPMEVANALHCRLQRGQPAEEQVLEQLAACELLLVLDNVEQLLDREKSIQWLHRLLREAPGITLLVTSRIALQVKEARTFPLRGLSFDPTQPDPKLRLEQDAAQLFIQTVKRRRPSYDPLDDAHFISDVCLHLEGYPLGIELAAGAILDADGEGRRTQLDELLLELRSPWANESERHQSLHRVFHQSWRLLGGTEQALLAGFSVFSKGATQRACQDLLGAANNSLQSLVEHSLLQHEVDRFHIHEALLPSVAEQLSEETRSALEKDHCHWFLSQLHNTREAHAPLSSVQRRFFALELGNIKKAWLWAVEQGVWDLVKETSFAVFDFFSSEDRAHEGSYWLSDALDAWPLSEGEPTSTESVSQGYVLTYAAGLLLRTEHFEEAIALAKKAIANFPQDAPSEGLAFAWNVLGNIDIYKGAYADAKEKLLQADDMYRELALVCGRLRPLINLGSACLRGGEYIEATDFLKSGLALCEQIEAQNGSKDEHAFAHILNNMGVVAIIQGDFPAAQTHLELCAEVSQRIGYYQLEAAAWENLGEIALRSGQPGLALAHAQLSFQKYDEIRDLSGALRTFSTTLPALHEVGGASRSLPHCLDGIAQARRVQKKPILMGFLTTMAQLLAKFGEAERASELADFLLSQAATEQQHITQLEELRHTLSSMALPQTPMESPGDTSSDKPNVKYWLAQLKAIFLTLHSLENGSDITQP